MLTSRLVAPLEVWLPETASTEPLVFHLIEEATCMYICMHMQQHVYMHAHASCIMHMHMHMPCMACRRER